VEGWWIEDVRLEETAELLKRRTAYCPCRWRLTGAARVIHETGGHGYTPDECSETNSVTVDVEASVLATDAERSESANTQTVIRGCVRCETGKPGNKTADVVEEAETVGKTLANWSWSGAVGTVESCFESAFRRACSEWLVKTA
jgi:hypothetical protein